MVQQFLSYGLPPGKTTTGASTTGASTTGASTTGASTTGGDRATGATGPADVMLTSWLLASGAVAFPPSGVLATTPPSEVTPDSSSFYDGQYVPPGLQPGQVPGKCPM
jgi:hypothetical protein